MWVTVGRASQTQHTDTYVLTHNLDQSNQVKVFVSALTKESHARGTALFQRADLQELAEKRLHLQVRWLVGWELRCPVCVCVARLYRWVGGWVKDVWVDGARLMLAPLPYQNRSTTSTAFWTCSTTRRTS